MLLVTDSDLVKDEVWTEKERLGFGIQVNERRLRIGRGERGERLVVVGGGEPLRARLSRDLVTVKM